MALGKRLSLCVLSALFLATRLSFAGMSVDKSRAYEDFPLAPSKARNPSALHVSFSLDMPSMVRAVTLHLKSGDGWHTADLSKRHIDYTAPVTMRIPLSAFSADGSAGPIEKSTLIRLSAWMDNPMEGDASISAAFTGKADYAIAAKKTLSPGDDGNAMAKYVQRLESLLCKAGIEYDVIDISKEALKGYKAVAVPYLGKGKAQEEVLMGYLRSGGRIVLFYHHSPLLGSAMGIESIPWKLDALPWTAVQYGEDGSPRRRFPYFTANTMGVRPKKGGSAKTAAWLVDSTGEKSRNAAVVVSPKGAWFSHIPPRAYPAAADLVGAIMRGEAPKGGNVSKIGNLPKDGMVAAWLLSPLPRMRGGWKKAAPLYKSLGINTIFLRVQSAASLIGPYRGDAGENIEEAIRECRKNGISLHGWVACFSADGLEKEDRKIFEEKRLFSKENGDWLDPAKSENRRILCKSLAELAKYGLDGIHLDYVRSFDTAPQSKEAAKAIDSFVKEASRAIRGENRRIEISAAVFPTPQSAKRRNQNWPGWIKAGYVDFVTPMTYAATAENFSRQIALCLDSAPPEKIVPGIATGANDCQLDAKTAERQIGISRKCRGIAFFALEDALLELLGHRP